MIACEEGDIVTMKHCSLGGNVYHVRQFFPLPMKYHRFAAELLGAFCLTLVVWLSVAFTMDVPGPFIAALTLGLFVYMVGGISGAHLNPAVTIGMLSIGKIKTNDAVVYIICQLAGATLAMTMGRAMSQQLGFISGEGTFSTGIGEALGAFFLTFAVASVTLQRVPAAAAGFVVGGSLLLGLYIASPFSAAILNPAVALGVGAFGPMYILGPIVGAVAGAWARLKLEDGKHNHP